MSDNPVKNIFVFVVCGDDKHVNTLNFSIKYLRFFSKNNIIVVTDLKRNNLKIEHDTILSFDTPEHYNHHQASIWLKTGLHRLLPEGNNYCYLDTDVIALSRTVDDIFNFKTGPVTFAPDHCVLRFFSPTAINCSCSEIFSERKKNFTNVLDSMIPGFDYEKNIHGLDARIINRTIQNATSKPLQNIVFLTKLFLRDFLPSSLAPKVFGRFLYSKKSRAWIDINNNIIMYVILAFNHEIKKKSDYYFNYFRSTWWKKKQGEVFDTKGCRHLIECVQKKFNIRIKNNNWQHWNGGVFLFNSDSMDFMDAWHTMTIEIFKDPEWKTRDQGTLAATAWKFGLQNQKCLPEKFNFLADFNNPQITAEIKNGVLVSKKGNKIFQPAFIHIYHKFGYKGWDVWDAVEKINPDRSKDLSKIISFDNKKVHGLWIGNKLSCIELLCLNSFLKNGHEFHLWVYNKIDTPLPPGIIFEDASKIIPHDQVFYYKNTNQYGHGKGSYAGFSDIFRYKLLYELGGWWSDMDVVCLRPLNLKDPYVFRTHHDFPVVGNIMKCPAGSELMKCCFEQALTKVTADNKDWNLPIQILNKNIEQLHLQKYIHDISNPDDWNYIKKVLLRNIKIPSNWYILHLINEEWRKNHIEKNAIPQKSFIGKAIREFGLYHQTSLKVKLINYFRIIFTNNLTFPHILYTTLDKPQYPVLLSL